MASLWKIDAAEAIPQAQDFLQSWLSGLKPEIALKETQLNSIKKLNENSYYNFPHPYFWGSFNLLSRN